MHQNMESWKVKSLGWMTFNYIGYGFAYLELLKVFTLGIDKKTKVVNLTDIPNEKSVFVYYTAVGMLIATSFILSVLHIVFKQSIKKYFARVMFKEELRKEFAVKKINPDFP